MSNRSGGDMPSLTRQSSNVLAAEGNGILNSSAAVEQTSPVAPQVHSNTRNFDRAEPHRPSYAALDLGTNNCRLLVAAPTKPGRFRVVDSFSRIVRLGEGLGATGLAPASQDSGMMRVRRAIAGGRRALRHVLFRAAVAAACHNPVLQPVAQRRKTRGKPQSASSQSPAGSSPAQTRCSRPVSHGSLRSAHGHSC